ncbi:DUF58 domain-containing protein [Rhodoflexus caldus]|uniref:DUF58 domain-containing protein n=1 Tax=Rhodoflexus caldus TaxID=2891236 RepID=UPI00202A9AA2|nr:DUF58 domain-containing protein [Rhodoflexus caldus]
MRKLAATYLQNRLLVACGILIGLFALSFSVEWLFVPAKILAGVLFSFVVIDFVLLFMRREGIRARRLMGDKLSNGDENQVTVELYNAYPFYANVEILDEAPEQFQARHLRLFGKIAPEKSIAPFYKLRPTKRGVYTFGALNVFVVSPVGLLARRYRFEEGRSVPVYPSFLQMRKYELMVISDRLKEAGLKRLRRIGQNMEFEQIREYVTGDDYRSLNWKATARRNQLMVNQFQDERSQHVYNVIDKGRAMKMPFEGLTLLDYAINAALVMANISLLKGDKAGLVTFNQRMGTVLPAERKQAQMQKIVEALYSQKTSYKEPDYDLLFATLLQKIKQRSLLIIYTNFETQSSLERQLPGLKNLAKRHLVVVVIFKNTELYSLLQMNPRSLEDVYLKTTAEKFMYEKDLIVKQLAQNGIHAVLTEPAHLTVNTINKYLELKARHLI